jgi:glycosyltransferase involved in cell wall biosynthesis
MITSAVASRPKIAVFDYQVRSDSAQGGCHLRMLTGLCDKYDFTVFAVDFENPAPGRIRFVRIPAPIRPTILLSAVFHLLAPLYYFTYRLKHRVRFDLVERMEVFTFLGSIAYIHFCHRAYLSNYWRESKQPGLRGVLLSLDHATRAYLLEPILYRLARKLVVPSRGLARELIKAYPFTHNKIAILPNAADYHRLSAVPQDFDRESFRLRRGFEPVDMVIVFIALGQFERKGFPQLLDAMALVMKPHVKLLVVGGSSHWISEYGARAEQLSIHAQVNFVGMQRDVAPFLWASDVFCLPSLYEVFPLVVIEAAAAGRAILVTRLNGVEEYLIDDESGIFIERNSRSIAAGIERLVAIGPEGRHQLGKAAQCAAQQYTQEAFVAGWDELIEEHLFGRVRTVNRSPEKAEHVAI